MENRDPYKILGVDRNASEDDLRKAYRKGALKWHPDRQAGKTDQEKKEAEEKFKDLAWAWSILGDPKKKQQYDQFGITGDEQPGMSGGGGFSSGFDPREIFKNFMNGFGFSDDEDDGPFAGFFNRRHRRSSQRQQPQPGQSIQMNIPVSIEEIMNGIDKDIKYDIQARCSYCHGTGGDGIETCSHCNGTGMLTKTQRTPFGMIQNSSPCPYCNGTGKMIKHVCQHCNGTGFETKEMKLHVKISKGIENGHQEFYQGKGYEAKDKSQENGDLLLNFVHNYDTSKYSIQGNTLFELVDIPYYDCILGKEMTYNVANGDKVRVKIPEYCQDKQPIETSLRFGSLRYAIVVNVKMPTYIRSKEKELLKKIQEENK